MSDTNFGIQTQPNPDRTMEVEMDGEIYVRYPIKTRLVNLGDDYMEVVKTFAVPHFQPGDIITLSEKMIGICQKRVVHESEVEASWLAKLIAKYVTKYSDDVGWENPKKIQVAIEQVGYPRSMLAVAVGGVMKFVFKKPGWYYEIMGRDVAAIDGFNPIAIPPFNEYATLAPANPDGVCNRIENETGVPAAIVDASNVAVHILGKSDVMPYTEAQLIKLLEGNPAGQEDEQTPIILIRPKRLDK
jgi:F420-0:gamma-glutamyl ligase-like protein